jgi:hypothetical protein
LHRFFTEEKVLGLSNTALEEQNATDLALRRKSS